LHWPSGLTDRGFGSDICFVEDGVMFDV